MRTGVGRGEEKKKRKGWTSRAGGDQPTQIRCRCRPCTPNHTTIHERLFPHPHLRVPRRTNHLPDVTGFLCFLFVSSKTIAGEVWGRKGKDADKLKNGACLASPSYACMQQTTLGRIGALPINHPSTPPSQIDCTRPIPCQTQQQQHIPARKRTHPRKTELSVRSPGIAQPVPPCHRAGLHAGLHPAFELKNTLFRSLSLSSVPKHTHAHGCVFIGGSRAATTLSRVRPFALLGPPFLAIEYTTQL